MQGVLQISAGTAVRSSLQWPSFLHTHARTHSCTPTWPNGHFALSQHAAADWHKQFKLGAAAKLACRRVCTIFIFLPFYFPLCFVLESPSSSPLPHPVFCPSCFSCFKFPPVLLISADYANLPQIPSTTTLFSNLRLFLQFNSSLSALLHLPLSVYLTSSGLCLMPSFIHEPNPAALAGVCLCRQ